MTKQFDITIVSLTEEESDGKWDFDVIVRNRKTGQSKSLKVSGGYQVAESYAEQLKKELV